MTELYNDTTNHDRAETAFCSLSALVPSRIKGVEDYYETARLALLGVTRMIQKAPKMTPNHARTMLERMSAGIGMSGLAEYLYDLGLDYDGSISSYKAVAELSEMHYHALLTASIQMVEDGTLPPVKGIDNNWLPIDTMRGKIKPTLDWEKLRGAHRAHSVLVANMPVESSSLFSGKSNGLYPPRSRYVYKKSRKGTILFICEGYEEGRNVSAWDVSGIVLASYYALVQNFTDQAISCDFYYNPEKYLETEGKRPMSEILQEFVAHFYQFGNKTMYYVNTKVKSDISLRNTAQTQKSTMAGVELIDDENECDDCKM